MRLLYFDETGRIRLTDDLFKDIPTYAILSHRWGSEEVLFHELNDGSGLNKQGYRKIQLCGEQARRDGIDHFWVDTCCIDKTNHVELQEAINGMFGFYRDAVHCYVFLEDVLCSAPKSAPGRSKLVKRVRLDSEPGVDEPSDEARWKAQFCSSAWFTRGWTLQELLAPASVEFFSREWMWLGNKRSLEQSIALAAHISVAVLRSQRLNDFPISDRFSWMDRRVTTREEDMVYALLGIMGVRMRLDYGEGRQTASLRLRKTIDEQILDPKAQACLHDLRTTDPRHDKKRIEDTKGGLLTEAYRWVLANMTFKQWLDGETGRLLWIKGDPGKGKTMLLCGILDELGVLIQRANPDTSPLLAYFFCQATDSRINNACAILRGLIFMLVEQQPALISHVRNRYDSAGKKLFEDINAWTALTEILSNILSDPGLHEVYLVIDALDECGTASMNHTGKSIQYQQDSEDLSRLLRLIAQHSSHPRVKWIVSSRNWSNIEEHLAAAAADNRLSLELNEKSVSTAVSVYIDHEIQKLAHLKNYDPVTRDSVNHHLVSNANGTFLWVALVCLELKKTPARKAVKKLTAFPSGLPELYERMMDQICNQDEDDMPLCKEILAAASVAYRPMTINELRSSIETLDGVPDNNLVEIIGLCGSFLVLRDRVVSFVHQSAKDFLLKSATDRIFPSGTEGAHYNNFSRSLKALSVLRRNMYNLRDPAIAIEDIEQPESDPLGNIGYACVHWIDHLCDSSVEKINESLQDDGPVDMFIRQRFLYWLEALSVIGAIPHGILSVLKLDSLLQTRSSQLGHLVQDARRFIQYHSTTIERYPLQTYSSALVFSPVKSLIRTQFKTEEPTWMTLKPIMDDHWSAHQATIQAHNYHLSSIACSSGGRLATYSAYERTIKIWHPATGQCQATIVADEESPRVLHVANCTDVPYFFKSYWHHMPLLAWSTDGHLAHSSLDMNVKIWDPSTGQHQIISKDDDSYVTFLIWLLSGQLAAVSSKILKPGTDMYTPREHVLKTWNPTTDDCCTVLHFKSGFPQCVVSRDGQLAWLESDSAHEQASSIIKIYNVLAREHQTELGLNDNIRYWAWSYDGRLAFYTELSKIIRIWNPITGVCQDLIPDSYGGFIVCLTWSPSGQLASADNHGNTRIWEPATGQCQRTLTIHLASPPDLSWLGDDRLVCTSDTHCDVEIWDARLDQSHELPKSHRHPVSALTWAPNGRWLASGAVESTDNLMIWNAADGRFETTLQTKSRHGIVQLLDWSKDERLAVMSHPGLVQIWDVKARECLFECGVNLESSQRYSLVRLVDGVQIATVDLHGDVDVCGENTDQHKRIQSKYPGRIRLIALAPDGTRLACLLQYTINIWDFEMDKCQVIPEGSVGYPNGLIWSSDGSRLASSYGWAGLIMIKVWNVTSGHCEATIFQLGHKVSSFEFDTSAGIYRLHSDAGLVMVRVSDGAIAFMRSLLFHLHEQSSWLSYRERNLLWIPPEYQASKVAVSSDRIAVGCFTGRVLMFGCSDNGAGARGAPEVAQELGLPEARTKDQFCHMDDDDLEALQWTIPHTSEEILYPPWVDQEWAWEQCRKYFGSDESGSDESGSDDENRDESDRGGEDREDEDSDSIESGGVDIYTDKSATL